MTAIIVDVKDGINMEDKIRALEKLTKFQDTKIKLVDEENKTLNKINNKLHLALNCAIELIETYLEYDDIKDTDACQRMMRLINEVNKLEEK